MSIPYEAEIHDIKKLEYEVIDNVSNLITLVISSSNTKPMLQNYLLE